MFELTKDTLKKTLEILKINDIIMPSDIDGLLVKKMAMSNILKKNRPVGDNGKQTHIAITSKERSLFPMVSSVSYYDKSEDVKFYDLKLPVTLIKSNIEPLDETKCLKFEGEFKETFSICYIRKDGENFQVQLSKLKADDKDFINFRELIFEEDYLCIIKKRNEFKFYFLILKKELKESFLEEFKCKENLLYLDKSALTEISKDDILEVSEVDKKIESLKKIDKPHNRIVYGAPGTGKSYQLNQEVGTYFTDLVKIKIKNKKSDNKNINYWVATCGEDNDYWDDFHAKNKFAIGWGGIEDLKQFTSLSSINEKLMEIYDYGEKNRTINYFKYIKTSMKKGDIIIIRKGRKNLIEGYGIIEDDYEYDISMPEDFYHTVPVKWQKKESIVLDEYSRNLPWATISSANDELVSLLSKNKYIEEAIETEEIKYEAINRVTFYDGYTHGQFVGTYKPVPEGASITYKYIPGPFMKQLVESYKNPDHNFCLIIEEINRAKADRVFGNIFQLLDRGTDGNSEYHIAVSADQETYLREELGDEYSETLDDLLNKGLYIPKNLYIWATMNSADQGVYPMDSAFKRRWRFEHIGLDENEGRFGDEGKTFGLTYQKEKDAGEMEKKIIPWNDFRKIINENLLGNSVSEDRLLAPFFIKEDNFDIKEGDLYQLDEKVFKNKILMYLFDDVLRHKKKTILFDENIESFSQLKTAWKDGKVIFHSAVIEKLETKKLVEESIVENVSEEA